MPEVHILSGGIDSASVLYRRLVETANEIHVLHVRRDAPTFLPGLAETKAAREVAVWLAKNARAFRYHEVTPIHLVGKPCSNTVFASCGFAVGDYIVRNPFISTVVQGSNGSPEDQTPESHFRNRYRENICVAVCDGYAPAPAWVYPHATLLKREVYQYMPPELRALCWTCANPSRDGDRFATCGACSKCRELQAAKEIS
jgi:7-cyano-7-deazaguanine synthase in queuosine biosynthesis